MTTDAVPRLRLGVEGLPWLVARVLGALSLLAVGIVHLQQYFDLYSEIPTIGTLFVLNFVGAAVVCVGLLAPLRRLGRWAGTARTLLALAGIAQAATAFVFLFISERTPLFGFQEPGYDPSAIMLSRIAEVATVVFLGAFLAGRLTRRRQRGR
jgi:amino acid transporter